MPHIPENILISIGLPIDQPVHYQLSPSALTQQTLQRKEGILNNTGALVISTGEFTGRSPENKFIVKDELTTNTIDWNNFNNPIDPIYFNQLHAKMIAWLAGKEIWIRDCYACADPVYRLNIRIINENPWSNLFAYNMFLRPEEASLQSFTADWQLFMRLGLRLTLQ